MLHQELSQAQRGVENAETALAVLGMNKAMARQLIATQLPTPDSLLRSRMDILFDCGQRALPGMCSYMCSRLTILSIRYNLTKLSVPLVGNGGYTPL